MSPTPADHDYIRLAGAATIFVVLSLVLLEFLGFGTITDTRIKLLMGGTATILGAHQAAKGLSQTLSSRSGSQSSTTDTSTNTTTNEEDGSKNR